MAKRKNKDIDVLYGIFGKLESNLFEEEIGFPKSCIRKSFLTKRKIEEWVSDSISYHEKANRILERYLSSWHIRRICFLVEYQEDFFPFDKYWIICFPNKYQISQQMHFHLVSTTQYVFDLIIEKRFVSTWSNTKLYVFSWNISKICFRLANTEAYISYQTWKNCSSKDMFSLGKY